MKVQTSIIAGGPVPRIDSTLVDIVVEFHQPEVMSLTVAVSSAGDDHQIKERAITRAKALVRQFCDTHRH